MMTQRIMIRLNAPMMDALRREAESMHTPVAILVRQAIWTVFGKKVERQRRGKAKTATR